MKKNKIDTSIERDPFNPTYSLKISDIYNTLGQVNTFQRKKYEPIIDYIVEYFQSNVKDIKLLDIGIGYGAFLKLCEERGLKNLYGMDPFPVSVNIAKKYTSAELRLGRIEDSSWPFEERCFDVITCLDVVEHLKNPEIFFINVKKYIAENGIVVIRTPNGQLPYLMRRIPFIGIRDSNPTHINVRNPKYWKRLAENNGFEILAEWRGEHLTHIKFMPLIQKVFESLKIDHRKIPILNMFEQAYIVILKIRARCKEKSELMLASLQRFSDDGR